MAHKRAIISQLFAAKGLHKAGTNGTSDQIPIQLTVVPSRGDLQKSGGGEFFSHRGVSLKNVSVSGYIHHDPFHLHLPFSHDFSEQNHVLASIH